jgi:hypothetical protein
METLLTNLSIGFHSVALTIVSAWSNVLIPINILFCFWCINRYANRCIAWLGSNGYHCDAAAGYLLYRRWAASHARWNILWVTI